jgi:hypothetical protein
VFFAGRQLGIQRDIACIGLLSITASGGHKQQATRIALPFNRSLIQLHLHMKKGRQAPLSHS